MAVQGIPEFSKVLRLYMKHTEKDFAEVLNTKAFFISRGASRNTERADRTKIEKELGVTGYKVRIGKRGKPLMRDGNVRWQRVYSSHTAPLAALIINSRLGRVGKRGLYGAAMRKTVEKLINKRRRSIGTLKAGWLGAIRLFGRAIGEKSDVAGASAAVKGRGGGRIAKPGRKTDVAIYYDVNSFGIEHRPYIDSRLAKALEQAFTHEVRSMWDYIKKKMNGRVESMNKTAPRLSPARAIAEVRRVMGGGK